MEPALPAAAGSQRSGTDGAFNDAPLALFLASKGSRGARGGSSLWRTSSTGRGDMGKDETICLAGGKAASPAGPSSAPATPSAAARHSGSSDGSRRLWRRVSSDGRTDGAGNSSKSLGAGEELWCRVRHCYVPWVAESG